MKNKKVTLSKFWFFLMVVISSLFIPLLGFGWATLLLSNKKQRKEGIIILILSFISLGIALYIINS